MRAIVHVEQLDESPDGGSLDLARPRHARSSSQSAQVSVGDEPSSRKFEAEAQRFWPTDIDVGDTVTDRRGGEYESTHQCVRLHEGGPDYAVGRNTRSDFALIRYSAIIDVHPPTRPQSLRD